MVSVRKTRRINRSSDKSHLNEGRGHGGAADHEKTTASDTTIRCAGRHIHHLLLQIGRQAARSGVREEKGLDPVHIRTVHAQRIGMDAHKGGCPCSIR